MPYRIGQRTKTKGWTILKKEHGAWHVIAHSETRKKAESSIRARQAGKHGWHKP